MSIFKTAMKAGLAPLKLAGGAAIGAGIGAIASDSQSATGRATDVMKGAVAGGAIAGLGIIGARNLGKAGWAASKGLGGAAWAGTKGAAKFAWKHPVIAGGTALAGAAILSGPPQRSVGGMAAISTLTGNPSTGFDPGEGTNIAQPERIAFEQSAAGLVQGLHSRRHRG